MLFALQSLGHQKLLGIVESDETFFLGSDGKKNLTHRKPPKRGISKEQICVVVAYDGNGQILSEVAGKGRITALEIDTILGNYLDDSALGAFLIFNNRARLLNINYLCKVAKQYFG